MNPANYLFPTLELYCTWLNLWTAYDIKTIGHQHVYTPRQFLKHDPENGLYGSADVIAVVPAAPCAVPRFMVITKVSDGDEGGPTELITWFEVNEDDTIEIVAMVQGFDCSYQFIYQDHKFMNTP